MHMNYLLFQHNLTNISVCISGCLMLVAEDVIEESELTRSDCGFNTSEACA